MADWEDVGGWEDVAPKSKLPAKQRQYYNPKDTDWVVGEMSTGERLAAGAGKAITDMGRGIAQWSGFGPSRQEIDESNDRDVPLMATGAGFLGNLVGNAAAMVPLSLIPGANTTVGTGLMGAGLGASQPVGKDDSRTMNTALGALTSIGAKIGMDKLAGFLGQRAANKTAEATAEQSRNSLRDATLSEAQKAGYVVPPSATGNTGFVANRLESVGGKAAVGQEAAGRNQEVTNALAKKAIGLPQDAPITPTVLSDLRERASAPYKEVASLPPVRDMKLMASELEKRIAAKEAALASSLQDEGRFATRAAEQEHLAANWTPVPGMPKAPYRYSPNLERIPEAQAAAADMKEIVKQRRLEVDFLQRQLDSLKSRGINEGANEFTFQSPAANLAALRDARSEAQQYFAHYERSATPESLRQANAAVARADKLEKALEDAALQSGRADLITQLRDARRYIAKTYDVEKALNVATGDVSAPILGRLLDKGKPLTGELATIAKFAEAFPSYAREGAKIPTPGVSKSEALASAVLGLGGVGVAGPMGAVAGALPLLSGPARSVALSKVGQSVMAKPDYVAPWSTRLAANAANNPMLKRSLPLASVPMVLGVTE